MPSMVTSSARGMAWAVARPPETLSSPAAVCSKALVGKNYLSVSVVYFQNLNFKFVAYVQDFCEINRMIVRVLIPGENAVRLCADIQDRLIGLDVDDLSLDYLSGVNGLERFVQHLFKGLL